MPVTFSEADNQTYAAVKQVMTRQYPDLAKAEVSIYVRFASPPRDKHGMPTGPAVKHHGYPALAVIKINSYSDREQGLKDATMTIDGERWAELPEKERFALLDHELMHLELVLDDEGNIQADDCGRPILKIRLHDFEIGGFHEIVKRHGGHAAEAQAVVLVTQTWKQGEFKWMVG